MVSSELSQPKTQANAELECERPDLTPDPINRGNDHESKTKGRKRKKKPELPEMGEP